MEIDSRDIEAAQQIIDAEGWPSRGRAPKWLARILRFSADVASRHVRESVDAERVTIAEQLEARAAEVREEEFFGAREGAEVLRGEAAIVRARGEALATLEVPPFVASIRAVGHCEAPGCDDGPACACLCGGCREAVAVLR